MVRRRDVSTERERDFGDQCGGGFAGRGLGTAPADDVVAGVVPPASAHFDAVGKTIARIVLWSSFAPGPDREPRTPIILHTFMFGGIGPMTACPVRDAFNTPSESVGSVSIERNCFISRCSIAVEVGCSIGTMRDADLHCLAPECHRHQCRHIAPKSEASEHPARSPNPWLRAFHILNDQRHMSSSRLACLALNPKARIEQPREIGPHLTAFVCADRRGLRLRQRPRHRHVAELLTRRAGDNQRRVTKLRAVQGQNVLDHHLRGIPVLAVGVPLNVKTHDIVPFGDASLGQTSEAAEQINHQRRLPAISHFSPRYVRESLCISSSVSESSSDNGAARTKKSTDMRRFDRVNSA